MEVSTPKLSSIRRGGMDGRKFFSRPLFRSPSFLFASAIWLLDAAILLMIIFEHAHQLGDAKTVALIVIFYLAIDAWWRARAYLDRVRDLFLDGTITEVVPGSALEILLSICARATTSVLHGGGTVILPLLLFLEYFLRHQC
jgi:prolipoprotein diacylglyceryltransferase